MLKILLHSCCAPCLTSTSEILSKDYEVAPFWYNPNIENKEEYQKRLDCFKNYCETKQFTPIIIEEYQNHNASWHEFIQGHESEAEGGSRCEKCIYFRLEKTARYAKEHGFSIFCTTLTVSPHKNAEMINRIGQELAKEYGIKYLAADFKKSGGYARSIELSREFNLYRQKYCGCLYSTKN